jgi:hypothetical protein
LKAQTGHRERTLKSKYIYLLFFLFLPFSVQDQAYGQLFQNRSAHSVHPQTHSLNIHYGDGLKIPSLIQKIGPAISIVPFKDTRQNRQYIGQHTTHGRVFAYFRSDPFPLERSIQDFFVAVLRKSSVDPIFTSAWNGKPEGMKSLKSDSILKVLINRFWMKAETTGGRTRVFMWVYLNLLLGLKKQERVLPQSIYVGEEIIHGPEFSPQVLTNSLNRTLRNVVETYLGSL